MRFATIFTRGLLATITIADPPVNEQVFEIISVKTSRSSVPQILSGSFGLLVQPTTCETICSNGGCCNTGGPCTTDGMCCLVREFACSDGGCCANGATCATVNGSQVCLSTVSCKAPIVTCGSGCCDAGMECVTGGTQFRCEATGGAINPSSPSTPTFLTLQQPAQTPQLGDGFRNSTTRRLTTPTYNISTITATWSTNVTPSEGVKPTSRTSTGTTQSAEAKTSSSSSSASMQSIFVFNLRYMFNIVGAVFFGAAFLLIN